LTIQQGGTVASMEGRIGDGGSSGSGMATVDGPGSAWTIGDLFMVGSHGEGALMISNGGMVSDATAYIGTFEDSLGTVNVDGTGSTWNTSGDLTVARAGYGTLTILNGGQVNATNVFVEQVAGGHGEILLANDGSTLDASGALVVGQAAVDKPTL